MDFRYTEEQRQIQQMAEAFSEEHFYPYAAQWDEEEIFPIETIRLSASLGFGGLYIDEAYGGAQLTRLDGAIIFEALSKGCVSTAAYISIHNMVADLINRFANPDQKAKWLPNLTSMKWLASYCLTESGAGSDASSLKLTAQRDGDSYILNGSKAFISGAGESDVYLVMGRTGGPGPKGISAFLVEKGAPGLTFGKKEQKMGWRSQPTRTVNFDHCRIPVDSLVSSEGNGFKMAMSGLDGGRINISACSLGGGQHCLDQAKAYVKERKQFGQSLSQFEALQFRIADMETNLCAARLMVHRAAQLLTLKNSSSSADSGIPSQADITMSCAMAKRFATDVGFQVVNEALQLHGGYGYIKDYQIERYVRDLRVHQILEGTNEIMRVIISRNVLDL